MIDKLTHNRKIVNRVDTARALEMQMVQGLNMAEIAKLQGVSKQAVHQALKKFKGIVLEHGELEAYRGRKADLLECAEKRLLNEVLDPAKLKKASVNNVAYALNTIGNMTRLEKGQSTSNISYQDMNKTLEELTREREQLQEALKDA